MNSAIVKERTFNRAAKSRSNTRVGHMDLRELKHCGTFHAKGWDSGALHDLADPAEAADTLVRRGEWAPRSRGKKRGN